MTLAKLNFAGAWAVLQGCVCKTKFTVRLQGEKK
jgi:hypothetical protein